MFSVLVLGYTVCFKLTGPRRYAVIRGLPHKARAFGSRNNALRVTKILATALNLQQVFTKTRLEDLDLSKAQPCKYFVYMDRGNPRKD